MIQDYSKLQLNFKYIPQRKLLPDESVLVENDEQATKALETIVGIKQEELKKKHALRQEYILSNPEKDSPTDTVYSQLLRDRF